MGKHAIGGMRSMMVPNRKADMQFRKKSYMRNKERAEADGSAGKWDRSENNGNVR